MKILLVAPQAIIFPTGLSFIAAVLRADGHEVDGFIFTGNDAALIEVLEKGTLSVKTSTSTRYEVVATGGLSSQYAQIKNILQIAKHFSVYTIVGGGIITSEPELMSRDLKADFSVVGEGERVVVDILQSLKNKSGLYHTLYPTIHEATNQIEDLDALPYPDYDTFNYADFLDSMKPTDMYYYDLFDYPREYPLVASRSCPFLCTFCYHPTGDKYRQRSLDSIFSELAVVIPKYHINIVSIFDELFSYDEDRVLEFCRRFKKLTRNLSWKVKWNCQIRVSGLQEEMLNDMKDAGCYMVSYGFESYSSKVLKSMNKHITPDQIHDAIHATLRQGLSIQGNFIFGDTAETMETAKETLDFWMAHREAGIMLGFIIACPNSEIYQRAIKKGIIKDKLDFIKNHLFDTINMTEMSDWKFYRLVTLIFKYVNRCYRFTVPLLKTATSVTVRCPHCKDLVWYNNYSMKKSMVMMYCRYCRKRFYIASRLYIYYKRFLAYTIPLFSYHLLLILKGIVAKKRR